MVTETKITVNDDITISEDVDLFSCPDISMELDTPMMLGGSSSSSSNSKKKKTKKFMPRLPDLDNDEILFPEDLGEGSSDDEVNLPI